MNKMSSLKVNENLAVPVKIPVPANRVTDVTDVTVKTQKNSPDTEEQGGSFDGFIPEVDDIPEIVDPNSNRWEN